MSGARLFGARTKQTRFIVQKGPKNAFSGLFFFSKIRRKNSPIFFLRHSLGLYALLQVNHRAWGITLKHYFLCVTWDPKNSKVSPVAEKDLIENIISYLNLAKSGKMKFSVTNKTPFLFSFHS